jgi:hypothetical protein
MRLDGGFSLAGIAVADFDGDKSDDLAVLVEHFSSYPYQLEGESLQILFNDGGGGFANRTLVAANDGGEQWGPLAVADLNGDGRPDLVFGTVTNTYDPYYGSYIGTVLGVRIAYSEADGGFVLSPEVTVIPDAGYYDSWVDLIVEDLNGDGHPDIALLDSNAVSILYALSDGGFLYSNDTVSPPSDAGFNPFALVGGDLNGDGLDDLLIPYGVYGYTNGYGWVDVYVSLVIQLQKPDGGFELAGDYTPMGNLQTDFSLSGAALYSFGQTVQIASYEADAGIVVDAVVPIGPFAQAALIVDLNGDGAPDLLISSTEFESGLSAGNDLLVLLGRDGGYELPVNALVSRGASLVFPAFERIIQADLNGDGLADAVAIRTPIGDPYSFTTTAFVNEIGTLQTSCGDGGAVR